MFGPPPLQKIRRRMYSGNLIKDLFETVVRAEAAAQVFTRTKASLPEDQDLTSDRADLESTTRRVPATVSSEPG